MKPILIHTNESTLNSQLNQANIIKEHLNILYSAYLNLGLPDLVSEQLHDLVTSENFVKCQLVEGVKNPSIQGLKISKQKLMEMLELPEGYEEFLAARIYFAEVPNYPGVGAHFFELFVIQKKEVVFNEKTLEKSKERFRIYAETKEGIETYNALKDIVNQVNKLNASGVITDTITLEGGLIEKEGAYNKSSFKVSYQGIKRVDDLSIRRANNK